MVFDGLMNCMSKKHKISIFKKTQQRAWKFYYQWRKTGSKSPAFGGEMIYVSRLGWDHLLDPRKKRSKIEKIRRFKALSLAKKLIEQSTTYQEHRTDRDISYWAFVAFLDGQKIKVVISARNKKKYFLSVIVLK